MTSRPSRSTETNALRLLRRDERVLTRFVRKYTLSGQVKRIVEDRVLSRLDHKNLNLDVPEFETLNPTTENIVVVIWRMLDGAFPEKLKKLILWETPRNYVEYSGEK